MQSTLGALRAVNGVDRWTVGVALAAFAQAKMREPAEALLKEFPAFRTQPSVLNSMLFLYANMDLLTEAESAHLPTRWTRLTVVRRSVSIAGSERQRGLRHHV